MTKSSAMNQDKISASLYKLRLVSVIIIYLAAVGGACTGVIFLDPSWLRGLGLFNMQFALAVTLIPALLASVIICHAKSCKPINKNLLIIVSLTFFFIGVIGSYYLGVAMIGI